MKTSHCVESCLLPETYPPGSLFLIRYSYSSSRDAYISKNVHFMIGWYRRDPAALLRYISICNGILYEDTTMYDAITLVDDWILAQEKNGKG